MINVRIDVTLSDSKGSPKTLTMTVADDQSGMNRTASGVDFNFNPPRFSPPPMPQPVKKSNPFRSGGLTSDDKRMDELLYQSDTHGLTAPSKPPERIRGVIIP